MVLAGVTSKLKEALGLWQDADSQSAEGSHTSELLVSKHTGRAWEECPLLTLQYTASQCTMSVATWPGALARKVGAATLSFKGQSGFPEMTMTTFVTSL